MTNNRGTNANCVTVCPNQLLSSVCRASSANNSSGTANRINNNLHPNNTNNKIRSILHLICVWLICLALPSSSPIGIWGQQLQMHRIIIRELSSNNLANAIYLRPFHANEHSLHPLSGHSDSLILTGDHVLKRFRRDDHRSAINTRTNQFDAVNLEISSNSITDSDVHSSAARTKKTPKLVRLSEVNTRKKRRRAQLTESPNEDSIFSDRSHHKIQNKSNLQHFAVVNQDYLQSSDSPIFVRRREPFPNSFHGPPKRRHRPEDSFSEYSHQNNEHLSADTELPNRLVFEPISRNISPRMMIANDRRHRQNSLNDGIEERVANRFLRDRQIADDIERGLEQSWVRRRRNQLFRDGLDDRPRPHYSDSDLEKRFNRKDTIRHRYRLNPNFDEHRNTDQFDSFRKSPYRNSGGVEKEINLRNSAFINSHNNDNGDKGNNLNNANSNLVDPSTGRTIVVDHFNNNNNNNRKLNRYSSYTDARSERTENGQNKIMLNYANERAINKLNANMPNAKLNLPTTTKEFNTKKDAPKQRLTESSIEISSLNNDSHSETINANNNNFKNNKHNNNGNKALESLMKGDDTVQHGTATVVRQVTQSNQDKIPEQMTNKEESGKTEQDNKEAEEAVDNLMSSVDQILPQSNHYSKTLAPVSSVKQLSTTAREHADESGPTTSDNYSKRDRGFGFIKAWAWDRAENYNTVTEKKKPEKYSKKSTSIVEN